MARGPLPPFCPQPVPSSPPLLPTPTVTRHSEQHSGRGLSPVRLSPPAQKPDGVTGPDIRGEDLDGAVAGRGKHVVLLRGHGDTQQRGRGAVQCTCWFSRTGEEQMSSERFSLLFLNKNAGSRQPDLAAPCSPGEGHVSLCGTCLV